MDSYSRLVAFLKVLLPLAALGILSTLFLLSRSVDPTTTLPFGEAEISERLRDERITGPYFSGTTDTGDQVILTASSARPGGPGELAEARDLAAQIRLARGGTVTLNADIGSFDPAADLARFTGAVRVETATGYRLTTDMLESAVNTLAARSPGQIDGTGPLGRLSAGQMELVTDPDTGTAHMVFKNGVKLIYEPKQGER